MRAPRDTAAASARTTPVRSAPAQTAPAQTVPAEEPAGADGAQRGGLAGRVLRRAWGSAWTMLVLTNLFWAGNIVTGRAVAGSIPPVALAYFRWTGAFLVAVAFALPRLRRDGPTLLRHWPILLVLAATGIASYNTMSYVGLQDTTALNALLLQSALPVLVLLWAFVLFGERPTAWQSAGLALSLLGVVTIVTGGSPFALARLTLNRGDVWLLAALVIYAFYTPLLRRRPKVDPLSFLVATMGIGSLMILPFYLAEKSTGAAIAPGWPALAALAYVAIFPSFIAYLCFNRAVELIGAGRAGQSAHLMPVFGSVLAVVFLGEAFQVHHALGIAAIAGGILLASRRPSLRHAAGAVVTAPEGQRCGCPPGGP